MTIGKRLYFGFGLILGLLALLLIVNLIAAGRQGTASQESAQANDNFRTIEAVRAQIMLNRLNLNNFLLSGDPRDEEKVNKGMTDLTDALKRGQAQTATDSVRMALIQVESTESSWADNFSKPLLAKRMNVSGKVKIEVIITPDGKVRSTRVIGGHPLLVQACQDAVKEWKFIAAAEETTQVIEFDFRGN